MKYDVTVDRQKYIGGSDIPIIMNLSPFKKRYDLLLEKAGIKEVENQSNKYTDFGQQAEPEIRQYINNTYSFNFKPDRKIIDNLRYHSDGYDKSLKCLLEIKTTSKICEDIKDYKLYLVQLLYGMVLHKVKKGVLAVYHRPDNFEEMQEINISKENLQIFNIDIDDYKNLVFSIEESIEKFEKDLYKLKLNPLLTEFELYPEELQESVKKLNDCLTLSSILEDKINKLKKDILEQMQNENIKKLKVDELAISLINTEKKTYLKII